MSYYISNKKIDVIVVTYNRLPLLKECLDALIVQKENIDKIFVIDNNSTDKTSAFLNGLRSNPIFYVKRLTQNIGGAAGFEMGVQIAMNKGNGNYIWIMDDDTIPSNSASYELLRAANQLHDNFGFLCSNDRWRDGSATNIPKASSRWTSLAAYGLIEVLNATFVSVLIKKSTVMKVGLPLGQMKIWGDDTEYTTRLSRHSPSYFVSNSIVLHKTEKNLSQVGINDISGDRIWRIRAMYRNLIYIDRKYFSKQKVLKSVLKDLWVSLSCFQARTAKYMRFSNVILGIIDGLTFNPKIKFPS